MFARITTVEDLSSAIQWAQTGSMLLYAGLVFSALIFGLSLLSVARRDERMAHAARRGQYALLVLTILASGILYTGIFEGWYFIKYIRHVTEENEVMAFKISALWASQQGSLLFWCLMLTGVCSAFSFSMRHNRTDRRLPWTMAVLAVVQFFFFFILTQPFDPEAALRSSPFAIEYQWMLSPEWRDLTIVSVQTQLASGAKLSGGQDINGLLQALQMAGAHDLTFGGIHHAIMNDPQSLPEPVQAWMLDSISDGNGLNPQLHNYWIAIHPPMLYAGFVGFTVPFGFAVGSLLAGDVGEGWLKPIRLWTMAAWGFLTVGIALGGLWAYEILGWGGYWAWDPVENSSFIPWLIGTAFIHSVVVVERRGMLRVWSFALVIITYCMTIVGTFLVRSGIINSVHAFGATGDVDAWFYGFIVIVFVGSLLLLVWRAPLLKSDRKFDSLISREGAFLANNLILVFIAATTLTITFWPLITEKFLGEGGIEELGQDAFVLINVPLFLAMLILTGVGPSLAWHKNSGRQLLRAFAVPVGVGVVAGVVNAVWLTSNDLLISTDKSDAIAHWSAWVRLIVQLTLWPISAFTLTCVLLEFWSGAKALSKGTKRNIISALGVITMKNRRRYGGYIVHIGIILIALGIYYSSFYENEGTLVARPGAYSVLDDKLSGDQFLVLYDTDQRTDSWDALDERFGRDPQRAAIYTNMMRYVRQNPEMDASDIIAQVESDMREQNGGQLPPFMAQSRDKMVAAIAWGVSQRDSKAVYESFEATLRVYPYQSPETLDTDAYLDAHSALFEFLQGPLSGTRDEQTAVLLVRDMLKPLLASDDYYKHFSDTLKNLADVDDATFAQNSGVDIATVTRVRTAFDAVIKRWSELLNAYNAAALTLGPELPSVNAELREQAARSSREDFSGMFGIATNDPDFAAKRFASLEGFEELHTSLERVHTRFRRTFVSSLAQTAGDDKAWEQVQNLGPLALAGLRDAHDHCVANENTEQAENLANLIDSIEQDAIVIRPTMRIFYDKRTGVPRVDEPVKDPKYHRQITRDLYFILQDADPDGRAVFRFFVKPHMTLGLFGLLVVILGTVLAFLPATRRRRKKVTA